MALPGAEPRRGRGGGRDALDAINVAEGAKDDAVFVINTGRDPKEVRAKLKAKPSQKVFTIDATKIAIETIGRPCRTHPCSVR